jgi:ATP-dependent RNA circularization protein (DNA/RNA ligase family)
MFVTPISLIFLGLWASTDCVITMTSISVKVEHRLKGASNFNIWKVRVLNIFEENGLDSFVTNVVEELNSNARRENFKKNQAKSKRINFYSVKDSIMPVIAPLKL